MIPNSLGSSIRFPVAPDVKLIFRNMTSLGQSFEKTFMVPCQQMRLNFSDSMSFSFALQRGCRWIDPHHILFRDLCCTEKMTF